MVVVRIVALLILGLLAGCSAASMEDTGVAPDALASGEVVVVLGDEIGLPACVRQVMQDSNPDIDFIGSLDFRNMLFPWFELATAPRTIEDLSSLLNKTKVQRRIESLQVRYVITVSGGTTETDREGSIIGGVSPAGGVIVGFTKWKKDTRLSAVVWDLSAAQKAETLQARVSGTAAIIAPGLPLPFIPATETEACNLLGNRLADFLAGDGRPEN
jgi:hypothetical protein